MVRFQELCESRGGRPGLSVLMMSLTVSVDVKQHFNQLLAALASVDFKQNELNSRFGLAVRRLANKQKDLGSTSLLYRLSLICF